MGMRKGPLERGQINLFDTPEVVECVARIVSEFLPDVTTTSLLVRRLAKALRTPDGAPAAIAGDTLPDEAIARLEALGAKVDRTFLRGTWLPPEPDQSCDLIQIVLDGGEWDEPVDVVFNVRFFDGKHRYFANGTEVHASRQPLTADGFLDAILSGRMGAGLSPRTQWDMYGEEIPWGTDGASVCTEVLIDDLEWEDVFSEHEDYGDFASPWDAGGVEEAEKDEENEECEWESESDEDFNERVGIGSG